MKGRMAALSCLLAYMLLASSAVAAGAGLKPGDKVGGATLSTGRQGGLVLGLACEGHRSDCQIPPVQKIAIGPDWWVKDQSYLDGSWAVQSFELDIDGQQVDLSAFGSVAEMVPRRGAPDQPPDKIVNYPARAWNVALLNPSLGTHTWHFKDTFNKATNDGWGDYPVGVHEESIQFTIVAGAPPVDPYTVDNAVTQAVGDQQLPATGVGDARIVAAVGLVLAGVLLLAGGSLRLRKPTGERTVAK